MSVAVGRCDVTWLQIYATRPISIHDVANGDTTAVAHNSLVGLAFDPLPFIKAFEASTSELQKLRKVALRKVGDLEDAEVERVLLFYSLSGSS